MDNNNNFNNDNRENESGNSGSYEYNSQNTEQNNSQDNSQQSYGLKKGENGEYYYSYSSPSENTKKETKKKGISGGAVAFLVVLMLVIGIVGGVVISSNIYKSGTADDDYKETKSKDTEQSIIIKDDDEEESQESTADTEEEKKEKETDSSSVIVKHSTDSEKLYTSVSEVVEDVSMTVVEITTETVTTSSFYGEYVESGAGSGVIITSDGYILTCDHVVTGATAITVKLNDGTSYDAEIIGEDSVTDIAVIKIDAENLAFATIGDSDELIVGADVIVIGNPLGSLGGTVTNGIISALDREVTIDNQAYNLLQTNAAINPGNSGGGMFNIYGELVGIVNAKSSGTGIEGLGFAIPVNDAIDVAEQLINLGYIAGRPQLGIYIYEVDDTSDIYSIRGTEYSALINYISTTGVYFLKYNEEVQTDGDLEFGDRIIAIDGVQVSTLSEISALLVSEHEVGEEVTITVARMTNMKIGRYEYVDVKLTLVEKQPTADN